MHSTMMLSFNNNFYPVHYKCSYIEKVKQLYIVIEPSRVIQISLHGYCSIGPLGGAHTYVVRRR